MAKQKSPITLQELLRRFLWIGVIVLVVVISYFVLIFPAAKTALQSRWVPTNLFTSNRESVSESPGGVGMMPDVAYPTVPGRMPSPSPMPPTTDGDAYLYDKDLLIDQKVIKTAYLDIQVDSVPEKITQIQLLAEQRQGFVQSSNVNEDKIGQKSGYITIKVPSDSFQSALSAIRSLALKVNSETTSGQDVTQQYVDLETNLTHLKAVEQRYLELLNQAKTVDEILKVQELLNNTQAQIQSLEGQLKYLANQVNYSTISVTMSEQERVEVPAEKFDWREEIRQGMITFVKVLQNFFSFLVVAFFVLLGLIPYALFFWLLYWLGRKLYLTMLKK